MPLQTLALLHKTSLHPLLLAASPLLPLAPTRALSLLRHFLSHLASSSSLSSPAEVLAAWTSSPSRVAALDILPDLRVEYNTTGSFYVIAAYDTEESKEESEEAVRDVVAGIENCKERLEEGEVRAYLYMYEVIENVALGGDGKEVVLKEPKPKPKGSIGKSQWEVAICSRFGDGAVKGSADLGGVWDPAQMPKSEADKEEERKNEEEKKKGWFALKRGGSMGKKAMERAGSASKKDTMERAGSASKKDTMERAGSARAGKGEKLERAGSSKKSGADENEHEHKHENALMKKLSRLSFKKHKEKQGEGEDAAGNEGKNKGEAKEHEARAPHAVEEVGKNEDAQEKAKENVKAEPSAPVADE